MFSEYQVSTVIFRPNVRSSDALRVTLHHVRRDQCSPGPSERYIEQHRAQDDSLASSGGSPARRTERRVTFCCSATCVTRYPNKPGVRWATHRYALRTSGLKITVYHQDQIFNTFPTVQSICPCHQYIPRYTLFSQCQDISVITQIRHADCLTTLISAYFSPILLGSDFWQLSSSEIHLSILFVVPDIHSVHPIQRWLPVLTKSSGLSAG